VGEEVEFYKRYGKICDNIDIEHISDQFPAVDYAGKLRAFDEKTKYGFDYRRIHICSQLFFKLNVMNDGKIIFGYPDGLYFDGFDVHKTTLYKAWTSQEFMTFLYDILKGDYSRYPECENCLRYGQGAVLPEDILDEHRNEILTKMPVYASNGHITTRGHMRCADGYC
jgi:hypothetical protein